MSFIIKQMLNNINTDIEALQLEDINIGLGGVALEQAIGSNTVNISGLRDEMDQSILDRITYAFQVTSDIYPANQSMTANVVSNFNLIEYCTPTGSFDTNNYQYIIPIDGIYSFSIKLFINTTEEKTFRIGIYLNETLKLQGGASAETSESMTCILRCEMGERVYIACVSTVGPVNVYMAAGHSVFNGYRIGNFV